VETTQQQHKSTRDKTVHDPSDYIITLPK
jgi:hypothetical protein